MTLQMVLAGLLVVACSAYAVWSLMPAALRRRVAVLRGKPMPAAGGACGGCDGCGSTAPASGSPKRPDGSAVIHIVRQPPRG